MVNQSWESEHLQDHPLVGKIWDAKTGQFSDPTDLIVHMQSQTFVLLGEKHDNADHHRIQAWITGQLFENKRKMAVAFEMFTLDKAEILEKFQASNPKSAAEIAEVTDWASSGWPDWEMYQPIAQLALDNGVPILATNMTRTQAMGMARENKTFLDAGALKRLRLDRPFPDALIDVKTKELIRSHCNMMPEHMIEPMLMA
ncbi:MAG: ChaN family lipoprotein, partial [Rhodospirillales bacterium]|nr:ChaN family lipoprotein [Rhodospirillales bacterium]